MISGKRSVHPSLTLLLICFVFAVKVLSGQTYIASAVEHAEVYSGVCLSIDPHCVVNAQKQVELEDEPSSALNLSFHLLSGPVSLLIGLVVLAPLPHVLHGRVTSLLMQSFPNSIFHPPRR